ncbi:MAG TPA: hypothetical protein VK843_05890 [Planctomycetota bacterium]|nr:hypothetical protein [Planctomycetota bacterium]
MILPRIFRSRIPSAPSRSTWGRIQSLDLAILIGIVAVVVIVSLPRLSAFAQRENEADAQRMVRRLTQLFDDDALNAAPPANTKALFDRLPRAARRQFEDQTVVDDGRVLLRHGYYFEFVHVPSFAGDTQGLMAVRAWPERRSGKGVPSFYGFSSTHVLRHKDLDPAPGGLDAPPQIEEQRRGDLRAKGWELVSASDAD